MFRLGTWVSQVRIYLKWENKKIKIISTFDLGTNVGRYVLTT